MKEIFEYDIWSIALTCCYVLACLLMLTMLLSKRSSIRKNDFVALLLSFGLMLFFFLMNHLLQFKSLPPDSSFYADIVKDFWRHYDSWSPGVKIYAILNFIPIQLSFKYPVVLVILHIFFYLTGVILTGKSIAIYSAHHGRKLPKDFFGQLLLVAAIYPAALIVIPSLLREGSMFFFFGLTTYLMILIRFSNGKFHRIKVFLFLVSLFVLTLIRPVGGVSYILAILTIHFLNIWKRNKLRAILKTIIPAALGLWFINKIADTFYNMQFSPDWLGRYRASHAELFNTEAYGTDLPWEGIINVLKSSFLLFFQYVFAPLPLIIGSEAMFEKTIPLLDAIFLLLGLIPLLYLLQEKPYRRVFVFAFVLLFVSALFETNINGSYRHRMNGIVLLLPLVVIGLNKLLVDLSRFARNISKDENKVREA
jgi:hypothetical protein